MRQGARFSGARITIARLEVVGHQALVAVAGGHGLRLALVVRHALDATLLYAMGTARRRTWRGYRPIVHVPPGKKKKTSKQIKLDKLYIIVGLSVVIK